jgi:hypothetical protein
MNMTEIERALRELRLSGIADTLSTRVMQAQAAQQPFLETFAAMRWRGATCSDDGRWPAEARHSHRQCAGPGTGRPLMVSAT